jgi:hypothetical protein
LVDTRLAGTPALGPALQGIGATEDFFGMLLQTKVPWWLLSGRHEWNNHLGAMEYYASKWKCQHWLYD